MRTKIKVLHITGILDCGGAENMLMAVFRHLDPGKISFDFLANTNERRVGYFDKEVLKLGGRIHTIKSQGELGPWRYVMALKKHLCDQGPYDIVHSHLDWQGGLVALAAHLAQVPRVFVHAHTAKLLSKRPSVRLFLPVQKWLIRRYASECLACSRKAGDFIFGKNSDIRIIPNAIDLSSFVAVPEKARDRLRAQWGCDDRTLVLVHAGSFSRVKNQEFLIDVAIYLKRQNVDFRLIFAGDTDTAYGQKIEEKVRTEGLSDRLLFLGIRNDLNRVFSACDRFLFPSLCEGLGIVCVEAQAAGLNCILSPGVPGEVDMGLNLIQRMESMSPERWAKEILSPTSHPPPSKQRTIENIQGKGYDIALNISELEKLYLSSP